MLMHKHFYYIPIMFVAAITNQIKASEDKQVLAALKLLELHTHSFINQEEKNAV